MRYVLRADASQAIGSGHVMRLSAIAEELIARGEEVIFVGSISNLPWVEDRIAELGFSEICENEKEFTPKSDSDVLILDSYQIPINDPFIDHSRWLKIVAIVDEQTPNYSCGLRIHPGLDASWVSDLTIPILTGPMLIPIRKSISKVITQVQRKDHVIRVAVVAGGSDPHNLIPEVAKILGKFSENFEAVLFSNFAFEEKLDLRFKQIEIGKQLDEVIQSVDLVLTTASTSSLEFLARGLCVGVACAVDNQKQNYDFLGQIGAAAQIGFRNSFNEWKLEIEVIHALLTSSRLRQNLQAKSHGLIDFNGAQRIVDAINSL
jgi:spore coat polysaccharide biosynthesis predicted glycosyltransferase SpsG